MNEAIISVGSNIDPEVHIQKLKDIVKERWPEAVFSVVQKTEPIGETKKEYYLNTAFLLKTDLSLQELNAETRTIETTLGRVRDQINKYTDRTIDLDIIVWNGKIIDEDVYKRDFLQTSIIELKPGVLKKD